MRVNSRLRSSGFAHVHCRPKFPILVDENILGGSTCAEGYIADLLIGETHGSQTVYVGFGDPGCVFGDLLGLSQHLDVPVR